LRYGTIAFMLFVLNDKGYLVSSSSLNQPGLKRNKFLNTMEPNANPKPMNNNGRIATLSFAIKNTIITIMAEVEHKKPITIAVFLFILIGFCFSFSD
jgi:hypothetical protein